MGIAQGKIKAPTNESLCFHSINIPSEWELKLNSCMVVDLCVSIQLISPASGNCSDDWNNGATGSKVSIQLISPASGNAIVVLPEEVARIVSIQLISPASGNFNASNLYLSARCTKEFPFN